MARCGMTIVRDGEPPLLLPCLLLHFRMPEEEIHSCWMQSLLYQFSAETKKIGFCNLYLITCCCQPALGSDIGVLGFAEFESGNGSGTIALIDQIGTAAGCLNIGLFKLHKLQIGLVGLPGYGQTAFHLCLCLIIVKLT